MRNSRGELASVVAVGSLIVLSLASIFTVSFVKQNRQTYNSLAAMPTDGYVGGYSATNTPKPYATSRPNPTSGGGGGASSGKTCVGAFYRSQQNAIASCGENNWQSCTRYGSDEYWECKNMPKPGGDGANTCGNQKTFAQEGTCKSNKDCTKGVCSQCYTDGVPRWYCGGSGPPGKPTDIPPTVDLTKTDGCLCVEGHYKGRSCRLYGYSCNNPTNTPTLAPNTCRCENGHWNLSCPNVAGQACGATPQATSTVAPKATAIPTKPPVATKAPVATNTPQPTATPAPAANKCPDGVLDDGTKLPQFPCNKLSECTAPNSGLSKVTAGTKDCCYQSNIKSGTIPNDLCLPSGGQWVPFRYPQKSVQQIITGIQTASTGEKIDCDINTCVLQ